MFQSRTTSAPFMAVLARLAAVFLACSFLGSTAPSRTPEPVPPPPHIVPVLGASPGNGAGLRVVAGRPQGEVPPDTQIALTFNKPVAPLATVGDQVQFAEPARIEPRP
jgi:hypothetical protein